MILSTRQDSPIAAQGSPRLRVVTFYGNDPKIKARLADLGNAPLALSPADFGKLIAQETEKWGKAVKFSGAKGGLMRQNVP
jgi:hypothetical protein